MKKYVVGIISMIVGLLIFVGCSANQKSEDTQKVIDKIVKYQNDVANVDIEDEKDKYHYKEEDFSFLVYYDKDQKLYLVDSWVPYEGESNNLRKKWGVSLEEDEPKQFTYDSDFNDYKKSGNYEVVYKSGKFED